MSILYKSDPTRGKMWQHRFADELPELSFEVWPECKDYSKVEYLVAWTPPEDFQSLLPNLKVVFSVGAGVDQFDMSALHTAGVKLVRMLDPAIKQGIIEYVTFAVLALHRDIPTYLSNRANLKWKERTWVSAQQRRVGVMGLGHLGQAVLEQLQFLGFQTLGWSRSARELPGVRCFSGEDGLQDFLAQSDLLICMLPLTDSTRGILCKELFEKLPQGAGVINVGRGGHLVDQDLIDALDSGRLSSAVLDVFQVEPLPADHPFWTHPKILMTPHIAAATSPDSGCDMLLENIRRYRDGLDMLGEVDPARGY